MDDKKKDILRARALALAKTPRSEDIGADQTIEVLEFALGNERYGFETKNTNEVHPLRMYTSLPGTPPFILGIMNLRGQILSIFDLSRFLELPLTNGSSSDDTNRKVIVARTEGLELGILVDSVFGIKRIKTTELETSLPSLTGRQSEFLSGVTQDRITILNLEKLLRNKDIIVGG